MVAGFFKMLEQIARFMIGLPIAVCATAVLGTVAIMALIYASAKDHAVRTAYGSKSVKDASSEALLSGVVSTIGWFWSQALPIFSDNAESFGEYAKEKEDLIPAAKGVSNSIHLTIPGEDNKKAVDKDGKSPPKKADVKVPKAFSSKVMPKDLVKEGAPGGSVSPKKAGKLSKKEIDKALKGGGGVSPAA